MAYAEDLKSSGRKAVWVRLPPRVPKFLECKFAKIRIDGGERYLAGAQAGLSFELRETQARESGRG